MKTTRLSALILAAALASAFTAVNSFGGSHTWSGAVDGKWSVAGNWSSGGAPVSGESPLHLSFPSGATRLTTTNDIAGLQIDSITITADGYVFAAQPGAGIVLKGAGLSIIGNGNATFGASVGITLNGFNYFTIGSGKQVTLDSAVGGSGLLAKIGPGTLRLRSAAGNSYSGGTLVNDGTLLLECGGVAVPGVLNIGSTNTSIPAVVKLAATEQIANDAPIIVYPSGRFDLNGFVETVGPLTFTGGGVYGNASSLLRLNGDVTGLFWFGLADLRAPISLGGTNRTFTTGLGSTIYIVNSISDGGPPVGVIKAGPGNLSLAASNSYTGMTFINEGRLTVHDNNGLGSTNAGTVVANGATLRMEGMTSVGAEPLVLNGVGINNVNGALQAAGTNTWSGSITLMSDSDVMVDLDRSQLTLSGQISGNGTLKKTGRGPLTFAGTAANLYTNATVVAEGLLLLGKPQNVNAVPGPLVIGDSNAAVSAVVVLLQHEQIANTSTVMLAANGILDCSNRVDSVGALIGNGSVLTGSGQINAGGDNSDFTFQGTISGTGTIAFNKIGTGTMTLAGTIASGGSQLHSGRWIVNGNHPGPITVHGPMSLAGTGTVGNLRFTGGGLLRPGTFFGNDPGVLTSGALSFTNGASFFVELFGTDAGSGYDQVDVTGSVNLTGSQLRVRLGAAMPAGSEFVLIRNDGMDAVTGTFDGLPEGGTFTTNAIQFQISYKGGDGNDVVLEQITPAPELRFQGITKTVLGQMRVIGSGVPGFTYQVQANTDLNSTNWIVIGSLVASPNGNFALTDTNSLNHPIRFYRFVHD